MFEGKAFVITGSGRGLGRAYALEVARRGGAIVVNDVDADCAEVVSNEIISAGGRATPSTADVSDPQQAEALIGECVERFGGIFGLVNNAGLVSVSAPEDEGPQLIRALVEVNVLGPIYCGNAAMRYMRKEGQGVIVNITSGSALGQANVQTYGATKGAVSSLVYNWAVDLEGTGIRVVGFSPTAMTRMADHFSSAFKANMPDIGTPEDIAAIVAYLMSDDASNLHGAIVRVSQGGALSLVEPPQIGSVLASQMPWTHRDLANVLRSVDAPRAKVPASGIKGK